MPIHESDLIINADGSIYHLGLRPGEVSELILTVGDPQRVEQLSRHFDRVEVRRQRREFVTHTGYLGNRRITVISSGIGTDNVEIVMTELDALFNVDFQTREVKPNPTQLRFLRVGTSGSLRKEIPVDSLVVSKTAVGLDTLMQFYELPQSPQEKQIGSTLKQVLSLEFTPYITNGDLNLLGKSTAFIQANTLTCPGFYAPQGRRVRLDPKETDYLELIRQIDPTVYSLGNSEMETAGYYAFATLLNHCFLSLNAIMANRETHVFSKQPEKTMDRLIVEALNLVTRLD